MTRPNKAAKRQRTRWKVQPDEVPSELRDNFVVRYLTSLTPEQEASIERAEELDEALGDGRPDEG